MALGKHELDPIGNKNPAFDLRKMALRPIIACPPLKRSLTSIRVSGCLSTNL
jgi:hypothetical protein